MHPRVGLEGREAVGDATVPPQVGANIEHFPGDASDGAKLQEHLTVWEFGARLHLCDKPEIQRAINLKHAANQEL